MFKLFSTLFAVATAVSCSVQQPAFPVAKFTTPSGEEVAVSMIHHGSIALSYKGFNIQMSVDTFKAAFVIIRHHQH